MQDSEFTSQQDENKIPIPYYQWGVEVKRRLKNLNISGDFVLIYF